MTITLDLAGRVALSQFIPSRVGSLKEQRLARSLRSRVELSDEEARACGSAPIPGGVKFDRDALEPLVLDMEDDECALIGEGIHLAMQAKRLATDDATFALTEQFESYIPEP